MNAAALKSNPALVAWAALMAFTLMQFVFGEGVGGDKVATVLVLIIAYVKINVIGHYFMELHSAPAPLRVGFAAFTGVTGTGLIIMYLVA